MQELKTKQNKDKAELRLSSIKEPWNEMGKKCLTVVKGYLEYAREQNLFLNRFDMSLHNTSFKHSYKTIALQNIIPPFPIASVCYSMIFIFS